MNNRGLIAILTVVILLLSQCKPAENKQSEPDNQGFQPGSFGYDLEFLQKHKETLILENGNAMLALIPDYQGRVMTSTATGMNGKSFGWLNYDLIGSGENAPHFNNYGGEERFWLGPEGGQFSVFFKPGVSFTFDNWQVPAPIDSDPFTLVEADASRATFSKDISLLNYSYFNFQLKVDRTVSLIGSEELQLLMGMDIPDGLEWVGYTTENTITNTGEEEWTKRNGLLSIWILGQFISSPDNTILIPFIPGDEQEYGPIVNDSYFGKISEERLFIGDSLIFFKADGKQRGKIGLSHQRSRNFLASYDSGQKVCTLVFFNKPEKSDGYVNSMWELQEHPFSGDVINSYNDGPLEDGSQMGPFYELETSSPAAALKPGRSLSHVSKTIHITGNENDLNLLLNKMFGLQAEEIKKVFGK